jgi:hypothetical protein
LLHHFSSRLVDNRRQPGDGVAATRTDQSCLIGEQSEQEKLEVNLGAVLRLTHRSSSRSFPYL